MTTNYLTLYEGLKIFRDAMLPFIVEKLQAAYGDDWWQQGVARNFKEEEIEQLRILFEKRHDSLVVERLGDELAEMLDINWFGNIIEGNWKSVFKDTFRDRKVVGWLAEVRETRNASPASSVAMPRAAPTTTSATGTTALPLTVSFTSTPAVLPPPCDSAARSHLADPH